MRFSDQLLDDIRTRLSVSQVVGRKVALKKRGREFVGLSPFKAERTPSFFVNDQKGFYHCFASGEHGDIFTFLIKTEGLTFPEAVEKLAGEAGVALPKQTDTDVRLGDERDRHFALLEAACAFFQDTLRGSSGAASRAYIDRRGLKRETIADFRIGYAPASRTALKDRLLAAGFTLAEMIATGMLIAGDDIPTPYDRFRDRVMFPIADLKGRIIAFGGRALDPAAPAKYLNSPETALFHKGANLFNAHRARSAAHQRGRIIAVEGYMDVIALHEGGFGEAVAPLGTALTPDQAQLLWRMAPEPILCFDGDAAGQKAAFRAIDTVLPHLRPGHSVRFAFLPDGLDPDDLIRREGAPAFAAHLQQARALFDVIWEREQQRHSGATPEGRALFETELMTLIRQISDAAVRGQYEREAREKFYSYSRSMVRQLAGSAPRNAGSKRDAARNRQGPALPDWRARERARSPGAGNRKGEPSRPAIATSDLAMKVESIPVREALLVITALNHPWLITDHAEDFAGADFASQTSARLREAMLRLSTNDILLDSSGLRTQLSTSGLGKDLDFVERMLTHKSDRFAGPDADRAEVEAGWRHTLALHQRHVGLRQSLEAAERSWHRDGSEDALNRIYEIKRQLQGTDGADEFAGNRI